jgi:hypothetical protein
MKLNLLLHGQDLRGGYLNVDPFAEPDSDKVVGSVTNLDALVHDAQADEIIALDILDFLPACDVDATLEHWVSKLRHGGTVTIGGLDLHEVARRFHLGQIDLDAANQLIHGRQRFPWEYRKSTLALSVLISKLLTLGLIPTRKVYSDEFYCVTARRP